MDNITIEISIGLDDNIPEHEGYYYSFKEAMEALIQLELEYKGGIE